MMEKRVTAHGAIVQRSDSRNFGLQTQEAARVDHIGRFLPWRLSSSNGRQLPYTASSQQGRLKA